MLQEITYLRGRAESLPHIYSVDKVMKSYGKVGPPTFILVTELTGLSFKTWKKDMDIFRATSNLTVADELNFLTKHNILAYAYATTFMS